jgi:hypothetical protein
MRLLFHRNELLQRRGDSAPGSGSRVEDTLKPAYRERSLACLTLTALLAGFGIIAPAAATAAQAKSAHTAPAAGDYPLPKVWHSESSKHDFRVEITNDLFRAEWINLPPEAAKQGAYIHTECRRAGSKWVGRSAISMLFAVPGAPPGKDVKLCSLTVRFEIDSVSAQKITGHSEALRNFDVKTCRVEQTAWGQFTWVPKK